MSSVVRRAVNSGSCDLVINEPVFLGDVKKKTAKPDLPYAKNSTTEPDLVVSYPAIHSSTDIEDINAGDLGYTKLRGNPYTGAVFYDSSVSKDLPYYFPGLGPVKSDLCGTVKHLHKCPLGDCVKVHYYKCLNYSCPDCYGSAAHQAAERIEDRVLGIGSVLRLNNIKTRYPNHVIISPPVGAFKPSDNLSTWRGKIYKIASDIGMIGGAVVFHPCRINKDILEQLRPLNKKGDSGGFWRLIHENALGFDSWRDYVYWSPHFHIIGFMPEIKIKSDDLFEATGYVYKVVKYKTGKSKAGVELYKPQIPSVAAVAHYLLTHHANIKGSTGYTYFGLLSYNKAQIIDKEEQIESIRCPKCGSILEKWTGFDINEDGTIDFSHACNHGDAECIRRWSVFKVKGLKIPGSIFGVYNPDKKGDLGNV